MADPLRSYRFQVEIDGITDAGFTEVSGFDSTSDVIEYREGKDPPFMRKYAGITKAGDITLKWGLTDDTRLFDWRQDIVDGKGNNRKTVYIIVLDDSGSEAARWQCDNAWPSKLDAPDFNATGNDIAISTMTLTCEEVKRTK